jgi:hypothetical protein
MMPLRVGIFIELQLTIALMEESAMKQKYSSVRSRSLV